MCGIFGYYDAKNNSISDISLRKMAEIIKHRGPDGLGYYNAEVSAVALGNQRLAILDVEHGQQPFYSNDKSIIVVQNGWGGWIRTSAWRHQKPLPYRLATPQTYNSRILFYYLH